MLLIMFDFMFRLCVWLKISPLWSLLCFDFVFDVVFDFVFNFIFRLCVRLYVSTDLTVRFNFAFHCRAFSVMGFRSNMCSTRLDRKINRNVQTLQTYVQTSKTHV